MADNELTDAMLKAIMPNFPSSKRAAILPILNQTAIAYDITNELRSSSWLATLAQESGEFRYQEEIASGDAYDTRTDLGNTAARDGDGRLYKGRGRIQITGKSNYREYTEYLRKKGHLPFIDFVAEPQNLKNEPYATDSAGWFFAVHIGANQLADRRQFKAIQIRVNGVNRETGLPNHWDLRLKYYERALRVIPDDLFLHIETPDELPDDTHPDFTHDETGLNSSVTADTASSSDSGEPEDAPALPGKLPSADEASANQNPEKPPNEAPVEIKQSPTQWFWTKFTTIVGGIFTGAYVIPSFNLTEGQLSLIKIMLPYLIIGTIVALCWHYGIKKLNNFKMTELVAKINSNPDLKDIKLVEAPAASPTLKTLSSFFAAVIVVVMVRFLT